jgi:hypothetical protein
MGNKAGTIRRPNAIAAIRKNQTAIISQSPAIIPFYTYFSRGGNGPAIQPQRNWLTRK